MENKDVHDLIKYIKAIIFDVKIKENIPEQFSEHKDFLEIDSAIKSIRESANAIGMGNLFYKIEGKGYTLGTLKNLQAALKNLTWQTKAITSGDFSQKVEFLGEFSDAFNKMTRKLEVSIDELKESEKMHRLLADNASDVIWTMNLEGKLTYISPSVKKLRGYSVEEVKNQSQEEILCPDSLIRMQQGLKEAVESVQNNLPFKDFRGELEQPCKDGSTVWTEVTVSGIYNEEGGFIGMIGVTRDISNRRDMEREIRRLSVTDKLTQLYNRLKLDETLENELELSGEGKAAFSLILVDIDHFKLVNDTFGHQVGDTVLVEVSNILKNNVRSTDIIGRWGGEEFLIILPETDEKDGRLLAEKLREKIENNNFVTAGKLTASFGVSMYSYDVSPASIVSRADEALYLAKKNGRNRVEFL